MFIGSISLSLPSAPTQKSFVLFSFRRQFIARALNSVVLFRGRPIKYYDNYAYGYTPFTISSCVRLYSGCLDLTIFFSIFGYLALHQRIRFFFVFRK